MSLYKCKLFRLDHDTHKNCDPPNNWLIGIFICTNQTNKIFYSNHHFVPCQFTICDFFVLRYY